MIEASSTTQAGTRAAPRVEQRRGTWRTGLLGLHSILSFIFLYAPIVVLVVFSFTNDSFGVVWKGFTLKWYAQLLQNERLIDATINTLKVALVSTLISTVIGTLLALALERYHFRGRIGLDALLYLPIVIPEIVMALALLAFFAFSLGLLKNITGQQWRLSIVTVIISHIAFSISFVVVVVRASLKGFDRRLEEAAQDLGANEWQTFWRITFPLILPGIIGGALLAFTISLDDFIITYFTTGPGTSLLPIEVYGKVKRGVTPEINAISSIMLVFSMVLVFLSQFIQRQRK
jgi:spermidine/putrescine transport system permease protein